VLQNQSRSGCVIVNADNVTIRNYEIRNCRGWSINQIDSGDTGLLVEDVLIECSHSTGDAGITNQNYIFRRNEVLGCENLVWCTRNCVIEGNYLHDPIPYDPVTDPHTDSIQTPAGGGDIRVVHNRVYGGFLNQSNFGNSAATFPHTAGVTNVLVHDNIFAGGGYTLYCPGNDGGFTWTSNRFSRTLVSTVGGFGPIYSTCWQHTHSGNVYHETGAPID
jgi:hypothetical protein